MKKLLVLPLIAIALAIGMSSAQAASLTGLTVTNPTEGVSWGTSISGTSSTPGLRVYLLPVPGRFACGSIPDVDRRVSGVDDLWEWSAGSSGAFSVGPASYDRPDVVPGTYTFCAYLGTSTSVPAVSRRSATAEVRTAPGSISSVQLYGAAAQFETAQLVVGAHSQAALFSRLVTFLSPQPCPRPVVLDGDPVLAGATRLFNVAHEGVTAFQVGQPISPQDPGAHFICAYLTSNISGVVRAVGELPIDVRSNMWNPAYEREIRSRCLTTGPERASGFAATWAPDGSINMSWSPGPPGQVDAVVVAAPSGVPASQRQSYAYGPSETGVVIPRSPSGGSLGGGFQVQYTLKPYGSAGLASPFAVNQGLARFGLPWASVPKDVRGTATAVLYRGCGPDTPDMNDGEQQAIQGINQVVSRPPRLLGRTRIVRAGRKYFVTTRVRTPAAGAVKQAATYAAGVGSKRLEYYACVGSKPARRAATIVVRCRLNRWALAIARKRPFRVKVALTFTETGQVGRTVSRSVRISRIRGR